MARLAQAHTRTDVEEVEERRRRREEEQEEEEQEEEEEQKNVERGKNTQNNKHKPKRYVGGGRAVGRRAASQAG